MSPEGRNRPWLKTTALRPSSLHPNQECCTAQLEGVTFTVILCEVIPQSCATARHSKGAALLYCAMGGITRSGGEVH